MIFSKTLIRVRAIISKIVVLSVDAFNKALRNSIGLRKYRKARITEDRIITIPRFHRLFKRNTIMANTRLILMISIMRINITNEERNYTG
jgi:hypothetical protein